MNAEKLIGLLARFDDYGTERVHTFALTGNMAIGADWDADEAERFIRSAMSIGEPPGFIGHIPVVGSDGRVRYIEAKPETDHE